MHLNLIMSDVEETITTVDVDPETMEELVKVHSFRMTFIFFSVPFA